eukprot:Platyproteum_vivax@DN3314_c0_g1_i1.p1
MKTEISCLCFLFFFLHFMFAAAVVGPYSRLFVQWSRSYLQHTLNDGIGSIRNVVNAKPLQLVTLDVTGTILNTDRNIGQIYINALKDHLPPDPTVDLQLRNLVPQDVSLNFKDTFNQYSNTYPCFGAHHSMTSQEWWAAVVYETLRRSKVPPAGLSDPVFQKVFGNLFNVFTGESGWKMVPGTIDLLNALSLEKASRRHTPLILGVISNTDERVHPVMDAFNLTDRFDFILTSREEGVEKPAAELFQRALDRAELLTGRAIDRHYAVHIGDNMSKDVQGAEGAGWWAIYVNKKASHEHESFACKDLSGVWPLLEYLRIEE